MSAWTSRGTSYLQYIEECDNRVHAVFKAGHIITIQFECGAWIKINVKYQCALVIFEEGVNLERLFFLNGSLNRVIEPIEITILCCM